MHTNPTSDVTEWRGAVGWNDNHVTFEPDFTVETTYGEVHNKDDNLFAAAGNDDAAMEYGAVGDYIDGD